MPILLDTVTGLPVNPQPSAEEKQRILDERRFANVQVDSQLLMAALMYSVADATAQNVGYITHEGIPADAFLVAVHVVPELYNTVILTLGSAAFTPCMPVGSPIPILLITTTVHYREPAAE